MDLLLPGKEEALLALPPDEELRSRIEELASKSTEGRLTAEEHDEYEGYVRANKFAASLRFMARQMHTKRTTKLFSNPTSP